jgi:hypothetical protein
VLKIPGDVITPDELSKLVAGYQLARTLQKGDQDAKSLAFEPDVNSVLAKFTGPNVRRKRTEPDK